MTQENRAVVYSYDYQPGADFDVMAQLETSTTVELLQTAEGETIPEISRPDEYTGHLVRYGTGEVQLPAFLFTLGESMNAGDSGSISAVGSVLSSQLNLIETSLE